MTTKTKVSSKQTALDLTSQHEFALRLTLELARREGNLFFSPFGAWSLMALLLPGARGNTREALSRVLGLPTGDEDERWINDLRGLISDLQAGLPSASTSEQAVDRVLVRHSEMADVTSEKAKSRFHLAIANALWIEDGFSLEPDYVRKILEIFDAHAQELDLVGHSEAACKVINRWADESTGGKVNEILGPNEIDALTRLILTNATYFKAAWAKTFDPGEALSFHRLDGTDVEVPMMSQSTLLPYLEWDGLQVVELPYAGVHLSMVIVLPREVSDFEANLTAEGIEELLGSLDQTCQVWLWLPRFEFRNSLQLNPALRALGLEDVFDASADLSRLSREPGFQISQIKQVACVRVDEYGTEAAAVTVAHFIGAGMPPVERHMIVDRPFWFFIRDIHSGCILFAGRMEDPS